MAPYPTAITVAVCWTCPLRLDATCEPFADAQGYLCTGIQQGLDRHQPLAGSPSHASAWHGGAPPSPERPSAQPCCWRNCCPTAPGPQYVCLQVDASDSEHAMLRASANCGQHQLDIGSWRESAALVKTLDLVLTVDTGVAHLGGAMGKATWVLLPYAPDWRWQLHRADSPWYASIQLFRQSSPGDWSHPLRAVARPSPTGQCRSPHHATQPRPCRLYARLPPYRRLARCGGLQHQL